MPLVINNKKMLILWLFNTFIKNQTTKLIIRIYQKKLKTNVFL